MKTYGVIGYGSFGKLLVELLPADDPKLISTSQTLDSQDLPQNSKVTSLEELAESCDVIFLSIPLAAYEPLAEKLRPLLQPETLLVDVASVKVKPQELLPKLFPDHKNFLFTHPLFGPQSATERDLTGLKFVVTQPDGQHSAEVLKVFSDLGAEIVEMSADEHDRQMSYTHALTFFISHALAKMEIAEVELSAPSYQKLLTLRDLDLSHSEDLFGTIQSGNPYSKDTRKKLIDTLLEIDRQIDENN